MSDFTVPDMIEPIVAFRAWRVQQNGLGSMNQCALWPKRERMQAACPRSEPSIAYQPGWEVVPFRQEAFWLRDELLEGEQLVRHPSGVVGYTGPAPAYYHPQAYAMSAVAYVQGVQGPVSAPEPVEIPTRPSALILPTAWEFRIAHREIMHPPMHTASPVEECACGIYALKDRDMGSPYVTTGDAWGEVYLWGKVIEGEYGYRAQYAYPKSLEIHNPDMEPLLAEYGVPITNVSAVQIAVSKAVGSPSGRGARIGIGLNSLVILLVVIAFALGIVSWWNVAILSINLISMIALFIMLITPPR